MNPSSLDPATPILVGVGQSSERIDDEDYTGLSPVDLAARAARDAIADTGLTGEAADRLLARIDVIATTRQFETSTPLSPAPLGKSSNVPRSIASRLGIDPARAVLEAAGGETPQKLVAEFAAEIVAGRADTALITGAEAISTTRYFSDRDDKPSWHEDPEGSLEDRGYGLLAFVTRHTVAHGLTDMPMQYALCENARRARLGQDREAYAVGMGELFAPLSEVAAGNPHSMSSTTYTPAELANVDEDNRMIADPYPKRLVARDQVNQGAAVLVTSVGAARALGIDESRWVFLHGHAGAVEQPMMERSDLGAAPAAGAAVRAALAAAEVDLADIDFFDLYSCFPIAVSALIDDLGLEGDDPRGLTLTGGLPYFGGPGNNYSLHAIAEAVVRARREPGSLGLVGANGGLLSKYAVGIYSTTPRAWVPSASRAAQKVVDALPVVEHVELPDDGWATIETFTIKRSSRGATAYVVGRLEDGRRFLAHTEKGDETLVEHLEAVDQPVGEKVFVRSFGFGNRVAVSEERMDELFPPQPLILKDAYEFVEVRRDGRVLEITLNRPDARNALHPPAHEELEHILDTFFADPELWVAIITGAGEKAFCSGNDLVWGLTGQPIYMPKSGFGGITHRRTLPKPVIAAVNGFAMGGGFEIAMGSHLVVAAENATFALSEVKVGLIAAAGGLIRLPRQIPDKIAHELILTGKRLTAAEAHALGVVNRVVPEGNALEAARELAAEIVAASPTSVRLSLQTMEEARAYSDPTEAVNAPSQVLDALMFSFDAIEGMVAFAEKREPRWRNQ